MDNDGCVWMGKRVFCKLKNVNRFYSGLVVGETDNSITLRDIKGFLVKLNLDDLGLLQEEA